MSGNAWFCTSLEHLWQKFSRLIFEKLLLIVCVVFVYGCASDARNLKREIINASNKSKTEKVPLDVSIILGKKVKKICFQSNEYMFVEQFAELTKMDAPGFQSINPGEFVLWIFLESGSPIQVKFKKKEVMHQKGGNICTESSVLYISQETILFNLINQEEI